MKYWKIFNPFIIPVLFLLIFAIPRNPDMYRWGNTWGALISAGLVGYLLRGFFGNWIPGAALGWFLVSGVRMWAPPGLADWSVALAGSSCATLLLITLLMLLMADFMRLRLINALGYLCVTSSLILITRKIMGLDPYSFMNNTAADAALIAVMYPVLLRFQWAPFVPLKWRLPISLIPVVAIGMSASNTGFFGLLFAILVFTYGVGRGTRAPWYFAGAGVLLLGVLAAIYFPHAKLLNDQWRFAIWVFMITNWLKVPFFFAHLVGSGSGSFFLIGPKLQDTFNFLVDGKSYFAFMHNDYLQILFEQGYAGLVLFLSFGVVTLKKAQGRPWLFTSLATYGFIMLTQYPLHFFGSALIGALLVTEAYRGTRKT